MATKTNDVFVEVGRKIRSIARSEARQVSEPVSRWTVVDVSPLRMTNGDDVLEEGDEDFEVGGLSDVGVGDVVLVAIDGDGDYVGVGVVVSASGTSGLAALKARVSALETRATLVEGRATAAEARLTVLEGLRRVFNVAAVSSVSLGALDGNNITGVRISLHGYTSGTGGNSFIRIKPNGLASLSTHAISQRTLFPAAGPQSADAVYGAVPASSAGLVICPTDWATSTNTVSAEGTFHTPAAGVKRRNWLGTFMNQDIQTNQANILTGRILSGWDDTATAVTSLTLSIDAGTFTGRISLEIIP